ncbi:hypothetical protein KC19_4G207800 [Ceratodon purpureus]|uniref:Uncharacterized protein n=1 Tax=Ceratodon purpureus TaxID=3225 RepID=A0A8T0ID98_CERPU|nr:hypothetical protein KC19_4G207800 [Ceratodon purpureus]
MFADGSLRVPKSVHQIMARVILLSGLFAAGFFFLLNLLALCEARPISLQEPNNLKAIAREETTAPELIGASCTARDVKIYQGQTSTVGLPTYAVQISNTCLDPRCTISNVIVQCGLFHSAMFVNPAVFRRLDSTQGTCIVKNGNAMGHGEIVAFKYQENFKERLQLQSAKVTCSG